MAKKTVRRKRGRPVASPDEIQERSRLRELQRLRQVTLAASAAARALKRDRARLIADLEVLAAAVLHDIGFIALRKKDHDALMEENLGLREAILESERNFAALKAETERHARMAGAPST